MIARHRFRTCRPVSGSGIPLSVRGILLLMAVATACSGFTAEPALLKEYLRRVAFLQKTMPDITRVAEAVADDQMAHPGALFWTTLGDHNLSFGMEAGFRAGGPVNMYREGGKGDKERYRLFGVRTWTEDKNYWMEILQPLRSQGIRLLGFGPAVARPPDFPSDWWIDNGATDASIEQGPMNSLANITAYWVWCCEYSAALTRRGKHPGILLGMWLPSAEAHNSEAARPENVTKLYDCTTAIPPGQLGNAYLQAAEKAARSAFDADTQADVEAAAAIILRFIREKKTVGVCATAHYASGDIGYGIKSPFKPFHVIDRPKSVKENLKKDDLLLFLTDWQLNCPWFKYVDMVRGAKVHYIAWLHRSVQDSDEPYDDALARIRLDFTPGDAAVPVPFPPGKMAPVSSIEIALIYRCLDQMVADKLSKP
jgi:hypothetical protein